MKNIFWKKIVVAVLLLSTILSFSPVAYGKTTSVQQQMDALKIDMKKAALSYVEPALKGELVPSSFLYAVLNNVKKNYQETKIIILASSLSEKEKQTKLKELEVLYEEKIVKGLIPYIDAYNYATKYLEPILKELKEAEAKNDFLAVEKAYHKLSVQLKSRTSILYRFTGKAPRDLLLENYKKPADAKRDEMIVPVTIIMKLTEAQQLYKAGKLEEVKKAIEDIPSLVTKLSSTNLFHQALIKELERLRAIFFPALPLTPVVPTPPVTPPSTGGGGDNGGPSIPSSVKLAPGSLGKAGNKKITGLIPTTKYVVTKGTSYYGVLANGTLSPVQTVKIEAEKLAVALTGTEITGLTNGHSYKVEVVTPPVGPTKVLVEPGSVTGATAGDKKITGLIPATKYVVTKGTSYYGVLANGTLSPVQTTKIEAEKLAVALTDTEITGLTNGHSYKVEVVTPPVGQTIAQQFPDKKFAEAIAKWLGKTVDDTITKDEINSKFATTVPAPNILDVSNKGIESLVGIDIFNGTNIETLSVRYNLLTTLDISGLTSLQNLNADNNRFTSINVSGLTKLSFMNVSDNQLKSLDLRGLGLTNLKHLHVNDNSLTSLYVSGLTSLRQLFATNNNLTALDVSGLDSLITLKARPLTRAQVTGFNPLQHTDTDL